MESYLPSDSVEQVVEHDQATSLPWEPHALCLFHGKCKSYNAGKTNKKDSHEDLFKFISKL